MSLGTHVSLVYRNSRSTAERPASNEKNEEEEVEVKEKELGVDKHR